jgi:hypothetical protein
MAKRKAKPMIECLEEFKVAGDTAFGDLQGTTITALDINPTLTKRIVWAAVNPYYLKITAGVTTQWQALAELRFLKSKVVLGIVPLKLGNYVNLPAGDEKAYEFRGASVGPSLIFGSPNGGAGDIVSCEVPAFPVSIAADRVELFLKKRTTDNTANFVYGLRILSSAES